MNRKNNRGPCPNCGEYKVCPEIREDNYIIGYICDACGWDSNEPTIQYADPGQGDEA